MVHVEGVSKTFEVRPGGSSIDCTLLQNGAWIEITIEQQVVINGKTEVVSNGVRLDRTMAIMLRDELSRMIDDMPEAA